MPSDEIHQAETPDAPSVTNLIVLSDSSVRGADNGFEDLSTTRRKLNAQVAGNARLELEHLKKLLGAQDAAKQQAQAAAAELHKQLKLFENENGRIRGDLKKTQDQLAFTKQETSLEARRGADREDRLREELVESRRQATEAYDSVSGYRKKGLAILVLLVVLIPGMSWTAFKYFRSPAPPETAQDTNKPAESPAPVQIPVNRPATAASHDFAGALGRLDSALGAFSGQKPEDVLRRVHLANAARGVSVCSFEWNNGQVSMLFGNKAGINLDTAMSECADALDKAGK